MTNGSDPQHGSTPDRRPTRVPALDGIRALSWVLIFVFHASPDHAPGAWISISLFFTLSGYLITDSLITEHSRTGTVRIFRFYRRRLVRLAPALLTLAVAVFALSGPLHLHLTLLQFLAIIGYFGNILPFTTVGIESALTHTWSLAIEAQFYTLAPIAVVLLHVGTRRTALGASVLFAVAVSAIILSMAGVIDSSKDLYHSGVPHVFTLILGSAIAVCLSRKAWPRYPPILGTCLQLGTALLVIVFAFQVNYDSIALYRYGIFFGASIILGLALASVIQQDSTVTNRVLSCTPLCWIGVRSYSLYLWHFPVLYYFKNLQIGPLYILTSLFTTAILAEISWRAFEVNTLRAFDRTIMHLQKS